jgi:DNA-binding NarL/FixJ family response regulator
MSRIRVLIADDHVLVRSGVGALLGLEDDVQLVGTAATLDELLHGVEDLHPHVVVTDVRMPPTMTDEGIRAATELRRTHPGIAVLVLSQFLDPSYLRRLIENGSRSRGYLLKDRISGTGELVGAIRAIADGGSFIDPLVVESLVAEQTRSGTSRLGRLTPRERETLADVAQGRSNAAIAAASRVSERAVEKHMNSIFMKLDLVNDGATNRRVMAVLVLLGLADEPGR